MFNRGLFSCTPIYIYISSNLFAKNENNYEKIPKMCIAIRYMWTAHEMFFFFANSRLVLTVFLIY